MCFVERTTKSLTGSAYPMFEANGPGEAPLFTARLGVTKPHFDYGKLMLPHAAGPRAWRIIYIYTSQDLSASTDIKRNGN